MLPQVEAGGNLPARPQPAFWDPWRRPCPHLSPAGPWGLPCCGEERAGAAEHPGSQRPPLSLRPRSLAVPLQTLWHQLTRAPRSRDRGALWHHVTGYCPAPCAGHLPPAVRMRASAGDSEGSPEVLAPTCEKMLGDGLSLRVPT